MTSSGSEALLARLHRLHPKRIDLTLERVLRLLDRLNRPQQRLAPVVHIAGTNGKGSTLAMLDAMLTASGRRVQRYISPHLVRFNERVLLAGEPADDALLADALERCEQANAGLPITFFEITTAAALLIFAERPADILLLETGLGGRLDATNVVARPWLTLVSPVAMDHEAFLGDTIAAIATEKAGILKPGVPAIIGPQLAEAEAVLDRQAASLGAPALVHGRDWHVRESDGCLLVSDRHGSQRWPPPALRGVHQFANAGLAIMAARSLGDLAADDGAIAQGLSRVSWPARLQRLRQGPLVDLLGPLDELWLDGGHNPAAADMLARSLPELARGRPVHAVIGMLQTKDAASFLRPLIGPTASLQLLTIEGEPASRDAAELAAIAGSLGAHASAAAAPAAALAAIRANSKGPLLVLICGSLYLAGQVLRDNS